MVSWHEISLAGNICVNFIKQANIGKSDKWILPEEKNFEAVISRQLLTCIVIVIHSLRGSPVIWIAGKDDVELICEKLRDINWETMFDSYKIVQNVWILFELQ